MTPPVKIRIVCVDDSVDTRALFGLLTQDAFETVERLSDLSLLRETIERLSPDVVVLDLWMPGEDPIEAMSRLKSAHPGVHFLILSSDDDPKQVDRALANGATGYALKDGNIDRLLLAIREVAAGRRSTPLGGARMG